MMGFDSVGLVYLRVIVDTMLMYLSSVVLH